MSDENPIINYFIRSPRMLLYGLLEFSIQDKWALMALMGMCWDRRKGEAALTLKELEGPYKLTLREIEAITSVKHNALRRTEGKNPRDGVLDRWQDKGYVTIVDAMPLNEITGKPGREQTYLYVHLERIWQDNIEFSEQWRMPPSKLTDEETFEVVDKTTVHVVTKDKSKNGHVVNNTGHTVNAVVHHVNDTGHKETKTVHGASSNITLEDPKRIKRIKEEGRTTDISSINKNNSLKPKQTGYVKIYMKECIKAFWDGQEDHVHIDHAHDLYQQSDLIDIEKFRTKIDKAFSEAKIYESTWTGFFKYLERALNIQTRQSITSEIAEA